MQTGVLPNEEIEIDELFEEAAELFIKEGQASTSLLQRRLKLGYFRASRIMSQLENAGIVTKIAGEGIWIMQIKSMDELHLIENKQILKTISEDNKNVEQKYEKGLLVFKMLFSLPSNDLKAILKEICHGEVPAHFLSDDAIVKKVLLNDQPDELNIYNFDSLQIDKSGILYQNKNGGVKQLLKFDQYFKFPQ